MCRATRTGSPIDSGPGWRRLPPGLVARDGRDARAAKIGPPRVDSRSPSIVGLDQPARVFVEIERRHQMLMHRHEAGEIVNRAVDPDALGDAIVVGRDRCGSERKIFELCLVEGVGACGPRLASPPCANDIIGSKPALT